MPPLLPHKQLSYTDCYPKALSRWVPWYRSLTSCLTSSSALPTGKQEPTDPAVSLPRLARSWDPRGWEGDDQHHRSGAEAAAAVWQPPHHCALQVKPGWSSWATPPRGSAPPGAGEMVRIPKHVLDKPGGVGAGLAPPVLRRFPCGLSPEPSQQRQDRGFPSLRGFSFPVLEQEEQAPSVR